MKLLKMNYRWIFLLSLILFSCDRSYTPKPDGYLRVNYPKKEYILFDQADPYNFEYPVYFEIVPNNSRIAEPFWYDMKIPDFKGTIYLSYKSLENNVDAYIEDTRALVYKHASRSDGIVEIPFMDTANKRYGILYELDGNVASSIQFFLTDSIHHFLRGSLYFDTAPNRDSLNPIINFVKEDIEHLIETVQWK
jgi:gliding motility-associated lipoprotein GldD